ncbi:hypothetical protein BC830DRAFT_515469 [Chytriomyces sp. MP71]|nr:hypothetical protein BC830DRAFT_515469 [Chytriomyces sp. MP71]
MDARAAKKRNHDFERLLPVFGGVENHRRHDHIVPIHGRLHAAGALTEAQKSAGMDVRGEMHYPVPINPICSAFPSLCTL